MTTISDVDARRDLLALVYRSRRMPSLSISDDLDELSPLYGPSRDRAMNELFDAVAQRDGVAEGVIHWSEVIPDAAGTDRDGQALDAAMARVELALDALLGGA